MIRATHLTSALAGIGFCVLLEVNVLPDGLLVVAFMGLMIVFVVGVQDLNPRQAMARGIRPWLIPWDAENWRGFFTSDHLRNKLLPRVIRMAIWFATMVMMALGMTFYRS